MGRPNALGRLGECRLKSKALVDKGHIVVDGLWDTNHGNPRLTGGNLPADIERAANGAITTHNKEHVDAHALETIDNIPGVLAATGCSQKCAAMLVDARHGVAIEINHLPAIRGNEAFIAVAEPVDLANAIPFR